MIKMCLGINKFFTILSVKQILFRYIKNVLTRWKSIISHFGEKSISRHEKLNRRKERQMLDVVLLDEYFQKKNIKQYELAELMGITASALCSKMKGVRAFSVEESIRLSQILEIKWTDYKRIFGE